MILDCACEVPIPYPAPHKAHTCVRCSFYINPEWTSNDATVRTFFNRLAEAGFPADTTTGQPLTPDSWDRFRMDCEERERAGRPKFGLSFLGRQNAREGLEEAADLAIYALLDTLVARREGLEDEDLDVALRAAYFAWKAYDTLLDLREKRKAAPGLRGLRETTD